MTFHNLRAFREPRSRSVVEAFTCGCAKRRRSSRPARSAALARWSAAPEARLAHPQEHLLPLMVVAGAAAGDPGRVAFTSGIVLGLRLSAYHYG